MTDDEIDAMQAGREMDALIAEKVTGWKAQHLPGKCDGKYFIRCGACGAYGHGNCYGNGEGQIQIKCGEHVSCWEKAELPAYSTEIAAAWKIVEKMHMTVYTPGSSYSSGEYDSFSRGLYAAETQDGENGDGDTAPLAVCRAALKWIASHA